MISDTILQKANQWLTPLFDADTQQSVRALIENNPKELEDAFYKNLEFGTGGMRGIMGVGTNRLNKYTVGKNTQGLANYLKDSFPAEKEIAVAIAYDCRNNSQSLAQVVADVLSANGIRAYLFTDMRPTPELSFAVRYLKCKAGIVLTASHNPPEYNGYKVYWSDGAQLVPPQDKELVKVIEALDYEQINFDKQESLIEFINQDIDQAFIDSTLSNINFQTPIQAKENLKIVYTPLHGTSVKILPEVLKKAGYSNLYVVEEQAVPDGNFSTVQSPNPEEPEAFAMALKLAEQHKADIVIGTDPDSDRLGVGVRNQQGEIVLLNGNQTMVVMTAFLLEQWKRMGKLNGNQFVGSTIVSTPMMFDIADAYGVECKVGLTGFKWIAKFITDFPDMEFIGGGEESFGYMVGDSVRDKDAIGAALLVCEIAAQSKMAGSSLYQELLNLYLDYGYYKEHLISLTKKGLDGAAEINKMMQNLRNNPPTEIASQRVVMLEDYKTSIAKNLMDNQEYEISIPKSDVLIYYLEDGTKICARPSGTEPKIKFYMSLNRQIDSVEQLEVTDKEIDAQIAQIIAELQLG
ncbi:MAG: phospho-sugar mutase [Bacteroidota bacterium]|nr:phospho-sugar mutase [Bacteroidota bacterium]